MNKQVAQLASGALRTNQNVQLDRLGALVLKPQLYECIQ